MLFFSIIKLFLNSNSLHAFLFSYYLVFSKFNRIRFSTHNCNIQPVVLFLTNEINFAKHIKGNTKQNT